MPHNEDVTPDVLETVVQRVNSRRRGDLHRFFNPKSDWMRELERQRELDVFKNASKGAKWQQIATIPSYVEDFLIAQYGENFWQDPNFWKKHPELASLKPIHL